MEWTKPEFTVVAVTMEVTAYAATKSVRLRRGSSRAPPRSGVPNPA
jgi:coenzyme PQQ precursor peptide PqqA